VEFVGLCDGEVCMKVVLRKGFVGIGFASVLMWHSVVLVGLVCLGLISRLGCLYELFDVAYVLLFLHVGCPCASYPGYMLWVADVRECKSFCRRSLAG